MIGVEWWFFFEYIDSGTGEITAVQCICQSLRIYDWSAGCVDQICTFLHLGDGLCIDEVFGVFVDWAVKRYDVRAGKQLIQGNKFDKGRFVPFYMAFVSQYLAAESMAKFSSAASDSTGTHNSDRFAAKLTACLLYTSRCV